MWCRIAFAAGLSVAPLVDEDVLEPSVANEVDHALERAPEEAALSASASGLLPFETNGLSQTALAIRLVSTQRPNGRWYRGTNDVTATAVRLLRVARGERP